jgi:hypothetical protein
MNGDQMAHVTKILSAVENGNLSRDEIVRRLDKIVERELAKTDHSADIQLVSACEDLLWELNTSGKLAFASHMEENRSAVITRLIQKRKQKAAWRFTTRTIAVSVAVFVLISVLDGILNQGWFVQYVTDDEQQYVIQGQAIDPGLIDAGQAIGDGAAKELVTSDWMELVSFLGYEPKIPSVLPTGWKVVNYFANVLPDVSAMRVTYSSDELQFLFSLTRYSHQEDAYITFEQNVEGERMLVGGIDVNHAKNELRDRYIWFIENELFALAGIIADTDAKIIIESTIGGTGNE